MIAPAQRCQAVSAAVRRRRFFDVVETEYTLAATEADTAAGIATSSTPKSLNTPTTASTTATETMQIPTMVFAEIMVRPSLEAAYPHLFGRSPPIFHERGAFFEILCIYSATRA